MSKLLNESEELNEFLENHQLEEKFWNYCDVENPGPEILEDLCWIETDEGEEYWSQIYMLFLSEYEEI